MQKSVEHFSLALVEQSDANLKYKTHHVMTMRPNPKSSKPKGDFLSPYGPSLGKQTFILPGMEGENPLLGFVLKVLDGKSRKVLREHLESLLVFDFQVVSADMADAWHAIRRPKMLNYAVTSMVKTMRFTADLWIDSGKSPSDAEVDTPADRRVDVILPGQSFSLFHLFENRFFRRHPQFTGMYRDGTQQIRRHWPRFEESDYAMGLKPGLGVCRG